MTKPTLVSGHQESKTILPLDLKQLLVAVELGETDDSLLRYLGFLAQKVNITAAQFVHVIPPFNFYQALFEKVVPPVQEQQQAQRQLKEQLQDSIAQSIIGQGNTHLSFDILAGDPLEQVLNQVEATKADLLVIGQKANTQSHGILAKNLARKTKGNVLIIPQFSPNQLKTILVPVDFSASSAKALEMALSIRKQLQEPLRIVCLYVYRIPDFNTFKINQPWIQVKSVVEQNINDAFTAFLESCACQDQQEIERMIVMQKDGDVAEHIMKCAKTEQSDLIIMGAKGHSKVTLLLMGSVAEKLINRNDQQPVLLVR
ncbi:MAG: universal stress protein [Bacteroidota bacterium]